MTIDNNNDDGCTGHSHDHDHYSEGNDLGLSLQQYIDKSNVICYNEQQIGSCIHVLKPLQDRLIITNDTEYLQTLQSPNNDPELLLYIPFTEAVTINSICIYNGNNNTTSNNNTASPRRVKLFTNRDDIDFNLARELPCQQELYLVSDEHLVNYNTNNTDSDTSTLGSTVDYPCRPAGRFQNISSITIYIIDNYSYPLISNSSDNNDDIDNDSDSFCGTEITYIGFKGKGTKAKRHAVHAVYETKGMIEDHKVEGNIFGSKSIL